MTTIAQLHQILTNDTDLIPYDDLTRVASYIYLATSTLGSLVGLILLCAFLIHWREIETRTLLIISLTLGDVIGIITASSLISLDILKGGWSTGVAGCLWSSILAYGNSCISTYSLTFLAVERYYRICLSKDVSLQTGAIWVAFIWTLALVSATYPVWSNTYENTIGLSPSLQVCVISWWRPESNGIDLYTIITLTLQFLVLIYCYVMILIAYIQAKARERALRRDISSIATFTSKWDSLFINSSQLDTPGISEKEMKVLVMTCVISGCFIILWGPYNILINTSLLQHEPVSAGFDAFALTATIFNSCLNPILLYFFDAKIKANVNEIGRKLHRIGRKDSPSQPPRIELTIPSTPHTSIA